VVTTLRITPWSIVSRRIAEARKVDLLNFDAAEFEIDDAAIGIGRHLHSPLGLARYVISMGWISVEGREQSRCRRSQVVTIFFKDG
jgi:hypothetical protein